MKISRKNLFYSVMAILCAISFVAGKSTGTKSKVGHINSNELWQLMPEKKVADSEILAKKEQMVTFLKSEEQSLQQGLMKFIRDSLKMTDLQKQQERKKLIALQESLKTLPEQANQELADFQEAKYAPIREKMQKAIDEVAAENGYDMILDQAFGNIVYVRNESDNILNLVKAKLNL